MLKFAVELKLRWLDAAERVSSHITIKQKFERAGNLVKAAKFLKSRSPIDSILFFFCTSGNLCQLEVHLGECIFIQIWKSNNCLVKLVLQSHLKHIAILMQSFRCCTSGLIHAS